MTLPIDVMLKTKVMTGANPTAEKLKEELELVWKKATSSVKKAQNRQSVAANRRRRKEKFEVGDKVLLSTKHIKLVGSKQLKRSAKFAEKFIGPYEVKARVNSNAYTLTLPPTFQMHPTVNVTQLKRYVDGTEQFPSREVKDNRPSASGVRRQWDDRVGGRENTSRERERDEEAILDQMARIPTV